MPALPAPAPTDVTKSVIRSAMSHSGVLTGRRRRPMRRGCTELSASVSTRTVPMCVWPRVCDHLQAEALATGLGDPLIGDIDVRRLVNEPESVISEAVEEFFADRRPDDLFAYALLQPWDQGRRRRALLRRYQHQLRFLGATALGAAFVKRCMTPGSECSLASCRRPSRRVRPAPPDRPGRSRRVIDDVL